MSKCSVRIMRSYDYCQFELTREGECETQEDLDTLRLAVAADVDAMVEEYQEKQGYQAAEQTTSQLVFESDRDDPFYEGEAEEDEEDPIGEEMLFGSTALDARLRILHEMAKLPPAKSYQW